MKNLSALPSYPIAIVYVTVIVFTCFTSCRNDYLAQNSDIEYIECQAQEGAIGKGGGTITITDQNSELYGAGIENPGLSLSSSTNISVSIIQDVTAPNDSAIVVSFESKGHQFEKPVTIKLPNNADGTTNVYHLNNDSAYVKKLWW